MKKIISGFLAMLVIIALSGITTAQAPDEPYLIETFLNQDPDPAEPGKYLELRWKIEKFGNDPIENVEYTLDLEYPFFFDASDNPERDLGNLFGSTGEDEFYILFYKVRVDKDAPEGVYQVNLKHRTENSELWFSKEYDVRVEDRKSPEFVLGQLSTSPKTLASDIEEAELTIEIANIGDGDAENVLIEMELPEGFTPSYSYSDRDALGTIPAGSSKTATFYIDISKDTEGGIHEAKMSIRYKEADDDDNEYRREAIMLDLPLKDKPLFDIESVSLIPETIGPGSLAEIRLLIKNTGGEEAESVSVRAFKEATQPFDFDEKSDFIGKLEAGETGEAVLKIDIDPDATPKDYIIDLEIRAVDDTEVLVFDKTFSITISSSGSGDGITGAAITLPSLAGFIVILIIVGYAAYRLGKRKAKTKNSKK